MFQKRKAGRKIRNPIFSEAYGLLRRFRIPLDDLVRKAY